MNLAMLINLLWNVHAFFIIIWYGSSLPKFSFKKRLYDFSTTLEISCSLPFSRLLDICKLSRPHSPCVLLPLNPSHLVVNWQSLAPWSLFDRDLYQTLPMLWNVAYMRGCDTKYVWYARPYVGVYVFKCIFKLFSYKLFSYKLFLILYTCIWGEISHKWFYSWATLKNKNNYNKR